MKDSYFSIHNHTEYSNLRLLDCINKVEDLIQYAYDLGLSGICITDHESLSAHIKALKFYKEKCKEDEKWKDFKLGLGNEIYLCRNGLSSETYERGEKFPHFILVAKDLEGHRQLRELSTRAWSHSFMMFMTRVPTYYSDIEEIIGKNPGHVIASSACFLPGQQIKVRGGYKNIEDINQNDYVCNMYGEWEKVNQPTSRLFNGEGVAIYRGGRIDPIKCTDNHKFLVSTPNYYNYKGEKETLLYWEQAKNLGKFVSRSSKTFGVRPINLNFSNDKVINKKEYCHMLFPASKFSKRRVLTKERLTITPEVMRLFGLWLGDGSIDCGINPRITISFNESEFSIYYNSFVKKAIEEIGGVWSISHREESHKVDLICSCLDVYELFYFLFGPSHAETKYIPERLKHITKEYDMELLFGYLLADGCFRTKEFKACKAGEAVSASISKKLSQDYVDLFNDLGIQVSLFLQDERTGKDGVHHEKAYYTSISSLSAGKIDKKESYSHQDVIETFENIYKEHSKHRIVDLNGVEYLKIRIKKVVPIKIKEYVYCLNNNTHSFVCENMVVHNCLGNVLNTYRLEGKEKEARDFVKWGRSIFGEDFYLELQPAQYEEQIEYNKWLLALGKEIGVKCIVTTDSHYLKESDREVHASFLNSKEGDRETDEFYRYTYVMSADEVIKHMEGYLSKEAVQELFKNTLEIKDKVQTYDLAQGTIIPKLRDDRDKVAWTEWLSGVKIQDKYEYLNKYLNSEYEDDRYFLYLALTKIQDLGLDADSRQVYIERLEEEATELWLVSEGIRQRMSSYHLMVRQMVWLIWNKANSLVGPARGSAGAMLFNYLIGISDMNPLTQGIECPVWRYVYRDKLELSDIDFDSEGGKRPLIISTLQEEIEKQGGHCLGVATFGTLGTRSAILTAARGLGIDVDVAQYLATMIPQSRGMLWSLKDCIKGNPQKERKPIRQLIEEFEKYPNFLETALAIEGLVCQMGIHASGVVFYNGNISDYSCAMKAPNGQLITQWDLHDAERFGSLKADLLSVEAMDKIHKCLELLLEDGLIEWQGSLRKTYMKYLHPDVLDRDSVEMWKKVEENKILDLFQLEGATGRQALSIIKPRSIPELAALNSLMRLMPDKGEKTPAEEYAVYKNHPELLKKEVYDLEGTEKEKDILYNFLKKYNGVCESQENIMMLTRIPELIGFNYKDANKLRKIIAKKQMKEIPVFKEYLINKGIENGCSPDIVKYIWDVQVKRQLGYSFSSIVMVLTHLTRSSRGCNTKCLSFNQRERVVLTRVKSRVKLHLLKKEALCTIYINI